MLTRKFWHFLVLAMIQWLAVEAVHAEGGYIGANGSVLIAEPGCNSTAVVQVPGFTDLFIDRQMVAGDGRLAVAPTDCSGKGQRWGLTLNRMDWKTHTLSIVKPILDTSVDPQTGHSRAVVGGGWMQGAVIQSAYDADVVVYRGQYLVSYECIISNGGKYGVDGTSACVSVYDPSRHELDMRRTQVVISGIHLNGKFHAAAVPELLVFQDRLFVYWSALTNDNGKFTYIAVRGAELESTPDGIFVKGSRGKLIHSIDPAFTTEVWAPETNDHTANNAVDLRALWVNNGSIIVMSSQGGDGCTTPAGKSPGCFHLAIVRADQPLGEHVFNHARRIREERLPSNPQEYTRPIVDPEGKYWFIGHYLKPPANGTSEKRPVPGGDYWQKRKDGGVLVAFPVGDRSLWPTEDGGAAHGEESGHRGEGRGRDDDDR